MLEASIIGGILTLKLPSTLAGMLDSGVSGSAASPLLALFLSSYRENFNFSERQIGFSMAIYGFFASILSEFGSCCVRAIIFPAS